MNLKGAHGLAGRRHGDEVAANARLIAAAPDLLDALQALCEYAETSDDCQYGTLSTKFVRDVALPAIAKATGESHEPA